PWETNLCELAGYRLFFRGVWNDHQRPVHCMRKAGTMYPEWAHELLDAKSLRRAMSVGSLRYEVGSSVVTEPGQAPPAFRT
ncbi:MAG: hypothetical protein VXZ63_06680, partial [Planctomycetota bacterium]|nr:hypothetical protein [Planctomycetota bacterium]